MGSVTGLVSSGGTLSDTYGYKPYGEPNEAIGTAYNPYRYTSTYQDVSTGLYQMGTRYYDPKSGRFTQLDPLPGSSWGGKSYEYVSGNPINMVDPEGTWGFIIKEGVKRYGGKALGWAKNTGAGKWVGRQAGRVKNWGVRTGKHLVSPSSPIFGYGRGLNRNKWVRPGYTFNSSNPAKPRGHYFGIHTGTRSTPRWWPRRHPVEFRVPTWMYQ